MTVFRTRFGSFEYLSSRSACVMLPRLIKFFFTTIGTELITDLK